MLLIQQKLAISTCGNDKCLRSYNNKLFPGKTVLCMSFHVNNPREFCPNWHQIPWFHVIYPGFICFWFWTSSSHGISKTFAKKMMGFPSDLVSLSTKLPSKRHEKIQVVLYRVNFQFFDRSLGNPNFRSFTLPDPGTLQKVDGMESNLWTDFVCTVWEFSVSWSNLCLIIPKDCSHFFLHFSKALHFIYNYSINVLITCLNEFWPNVLERSL